jgi:hypothetical protein
MNARVDQIEERRGLAFPATLAVLLLAASPSLHACSDDSPASSPGSGRTDAGSAHDANGGDATSASDAAGDGQEPSANCVKPGTPNNEQFVGGYCETNAQCVKNESLCTALYGAPPNAWFCSKPCVDNEECGTGMYCADDPRGVACVPLVCGVADAGATDQ